MSAASTELLLKGARLCERSLAFVDTAQAALARANEELARSRFRLQQHTKRRASISVFPGIRLRLADGRLPHDSDPILVGHPGGGSLCDGCGRPLLTNQLVMDIPSGDHAFVHLHANCYTAWNAARLAP